jgi:iron complex transport system substrate-binding protein
MRKRIVMMMLAGSLASLAGLTGLTGCRPAAAPTASPVTSPPPAAEQTFPLTLTDDSGHQVTFSAAPRRIITLAPSLTEACFALGLGEQIVGVTSYCHYPPESETRPRIGGYVNASLEKIVALTPEVVFATRGTPLTFMESLRATGVPVFAVDQTNMEDVVTSLRQIGAICGVPARGEALAAELEQALASRRQQAEMIPRDQWLTGLYVVWLEPLFVAGAGSFQDEMLAACGVRNVAGLDKPFGSLSAEAVLEADPEVIILSREHGTDQPAEQLKALQTSPLWKNVRAVKMGQVYELNAEYMNVPGPRLQEGLRQLERLLLPLRGGPS